MMTLSGNGILHIIRIQNFVFNQGGALSSIRFPIERALPLRNFLHANLLIKLFC